MSNNIQIFHIHITSVPFKLTKKLINFLLIFCFCSWNHSWQKLKCSLARKCMTLSFSLYKIAGWLLFLLLNLKNLILKRLENVCFRCLQFFDDTMWLTFSSYSLLNSFNGTNEISSGGNCVALAHDKFCFSSCKQPFNDWTTVKFFTWAEWHRCSTVAPFL